MCSSMTNFTEESCLPPIVKSFGHIKAPSLNLLAQTDIIILQQSAASLMVPGVYTLAARGGARNFCLGGRFVLLIY